MPIDFAWTLLISLSVTVALELAFSLIFRIRRKSDLLLLVIVNVITNPPVVLLNYLILQRTELPQMLVAALLEASAVLIEGVYYRRYSENIRRPFLFSFGANAFSYILGLLLTIII